MSLPETTLSSPLLEAAYEQFFSEINFEVQSGKTETSRLVRSLLTISGGPRADTVIRHNPHMTPELSCLGSSSRVSDETAHRLLTDSSRFLTGYIQALVSGVAEGIELDLTGITSLDTRLDCNKRVLDAFKDMLYWTNVVEQAVDAAASSTWNLIASTWACRRFVLVHNDGKWIVLTYDAALRLTASAS